MRSTLSAFLWKRKNYTHSLCDGNVGQYIRPITTIQNNDMYAFNLIWFALILRLNNTRPQHFDVVCHQQGSWKNKKHNIMIFMAMWAQVKVWIVKHPWSMWAQWRELRLVSSNVLHSLDSHNVLIYIAQWMKHCAVHKSFGVCACIREEGNVIILLWLTELLF